MILHTKVSEVPVTLCCLQHTVRNPIRVLHLQVISIVPVLQIDIAHCIIGFKLLYSIKVLTTRKKINRGQRIEVLSLCQHILVIFSDELKGES